MKIRLNENEVYEIKLPEEIGIQELNMITLRFNALLRSFAKFTLGNEILISEKQIKNTGTPYKSRNRGQWKRLRDDRELFIKLLDNYYNEDCETFEKFKVDNGLEITRAEMSSTATIRIKELHNVNPNEVGLVKFPTKHEQICHLRIKTNSEEKTENE